MEKTIYTLKVTLTEPILGTQPQKDVAMEYLQDKARGKGIEVADENETLPEIIEKGTTVFHKLNGNPIYYDYHVKGFLKESASVHKELRGVKQLRSKLDNYVFIEPRRIELKMPKFMLVPSKFEEKKSESMSLEERVKVEYAEAHGEEYQPTYETVKYLEPVAFEKVPSKITYLERPLRAMTAQGPRVSLARSEMLPAETKFECSVIVLGAVITENILRDLFDYGAFKGFGQWRGASYGRFTYELVRQ